MEQQNEGNKETIGRKKETRILEPMLSPCRPESSFSMLSVCSLPLRVQLPHGRDGSSQTTRAAEGLPRA